MAQRQRHHHVTQEELISLIGDLSLPWNMTDQKLVTRYAASGSPGGAPIYLGIGETWTEVAAGLVRLTEKSWPVHLNGYLISQYGLPDLQKLLQRYIPVSHRLPADFKLGRDFEVAVAGNG